MKLFILCGGSGERMKSYSFPKPLNMIYGKPSIYYCLKDMPCTFDVFNFIYSKHLCEYNFEEVIINTFPKRKCTFYCVDYFTRGPVETAFQGIKDLEDTGDQVVFIDNDIVYSFPDNWSDVAPKTAFIGCRVDSTSSEAYSFLKVNNKRVVEIKEKKRISNVCCMGMYGFQSLTQFKDVATTLLQSHVNSELYMSSLYETMISNDITIEAVTFPSSYHIGSLHEVESSINKITVPKMRICFDLDNTLVTFPVITGDYTTVNPIKPMIDLAQTLHTSGHTIIIYTARGMRSHAGNIGSLTKDVCTIALSTLEKFNIPYDEIYFGKPFADIYIDDRAINPYRHDFRSLGLFQYKEKGVVINALPSNRFNTIELVDNKVVKKGSADLLKGQVFYYSNIQDSSKTTKYFPKLYSIKDVDDITTIEMEYIKGIPMFTLFKNKLLTADHLNNLLTIVDVLHNNTCKTPAPTREQVCNNYINKFKARISDRSIYTYPDVEKVSDACIKDITDYCSSSRVHIVDTIHGDLWFSNIIVGFDGLIKLIDVRGAVDGCLTLGGDPLYDYAKLYQSLLGYDSIIYESNYYSGYADELLQVFYKHLTKLDISINDIKVITKVLVIGTLPFIESETIRAKVWQWINVTL